MEIKARIAKLEQAARGKRQPGGNRCKCWNDCTVIVDAGDGMAEYPPERGQICHRCGRHFRGIPGNKQILVIVTGEGKQCKNTTAV